MAVHVDEWVLASIVGGLGLQVDDVQAMQRGETIDLLLLGDDMVNIAKTNNERTVAMDPHEFFRFNRATYVHDHDLSGTMTVHFQHGDAVDPAFMFNVVDDTRVAWLGTNHVLLWEGMPRTRVFWDTNEAAHNAWMDDDTVSLESVSTDDDRYSDSFVEVLRE